MELVNWFKRKYPSLVEDMRNCSHELSLSEPAIYHSEGDVWTHTLMVYNIVKRENIEIKLSCLLHDIGKPYTRIKQEEKNHYSFKNHENISMFMALPILREYEKDFNIVVNKELILQVINYHQDIHKLGSFENGEYQISSEELSFINRKFGSDFDLYSTLIICSKADADGRICCDTEKMDKQYSFFENYIPVETYKDFNNKPECYVLVGPPGVGKSTARENIIKSFNERKMDFVIISSDDIIMESNKKNVPYGMFWTIDKRDESLLEADKRMLNAIKERKSIIIDMTNIDQIARERRLAYVPDKYYHKIAYNFIADVDTLKQRNIQRKKDMRDIPINALEHYIKEYSFIGTDLVHTSKIIIN